MWIATGEQHSVRAFVDAAARELGIALEWRGRGPDECAMVASANGWAEHLKRGQVVAWVDARYFRPAEVDALAGDASLARRELGWEPRVKFAQLVAEMVREDLKSAQRDELVLWHGYRAAAGHD
jgi:GDPmannose 4,6-dehydratase